MQNIFGGLIVLLVFFGIVLASNLLISLLRFALRRLFTGKKSPGILQWSAQVTFSANQLSVMRSLWHWSKTGRRPTHDPLASLAPAELSDLLKKCSYEYVPSALRSDSQRQEREAFVHELSAKGLDGLSADIVCGMRFGRLGPARFE